MEMEVVIFIHVTYHLNMRLVNNRHYIEIAKNDNYNTADKKLTISMI